MQWPAEILDVMSYIIVRSKLVLTIHLSDCISPFSESPDEILSPELVSHAAEADTSSTQAGVFNPHKLTLGKTRPTAGSPCQLWALYRLEIQILASRPVS